MEMWLYEVIKLSVFCPVNETIEKGMNCTSFEVTITPSLLISHS
jgi:hypothetical protein